MDEKARSEVVLGVDTHLDLHVAAVIDLSGKLLRVVATPANASGYLQLLA